MLLSIIEVGCYIKTEAKKERRLKQNAKIEKEQQGKEGQEGWHNWGYAQYLFRHDLLYALDDPLGGNAGHTGKVAPQAGGVAIDATGTAGEVLHLYCILGRLTPSHESGKGMGGSPDAHHRSADNAGQMHISAIHAHHRVKATHENQFLIEGMEQRANTLCLREGFGPGRKEISLTSATTKRKKRHEG